MPSGLIIRLFQGGEAESNLTANGGIYCKMLTRVYGCLVDDSRESVLLHLWKELGLLESEKGAVDEKEVKKRRSVNSSDTGC